MAAVPFDTPKLARRLESAGFSPKQAGDTAEALAEAMSGSDLATKADLAATKVGIEAEIAGVKAEIAALRVELKGEIALVRRDMEVLRRDMRSAWDAAVHASAPATPQRPHSDTARATCSRSCG
jgi:hypothetical protein